MTDNPQVIVTGNPVDGITLTGPFRDSDAATTYAERISHGDSWWITDLNTGKYEQTVHLLAISAPDSDGLAVMARLDVQSLVEDLSGNYDPEQEFSPRCFWLAGNPEVDESTFGDWVEKFAAFLGLTIAYDIQEI